VTSDLGAARPPLVAPAGGAAGLVRHVLLFGRMIRFSHSIFALPFALASAALAIEGGVPWSKLALIVVAMVGARSAAMGFNRLADHAIDARNPRTARRELPMGLLSRAQVTVFVALSAAVFVTAAALLNPLCLKLSPLALVIVLGYSYAKRFSVLSHALLGTSLAIAPVGAWVAIRGEFGLVPVALGLAVLLWTAGFDTIYACQDVEVDRREGLHSLPARVGVAKALVAARGMHVLALALLASLYWLTALEPLYLGGVAVVAGLLVYEHSLVRADDLRRVDAAFFTANAWVSMGYLAATLLARWL
jgi:4-hydroxybenzoate polyprenyltransferase